MLDKPFTVVIYLVVGLLIVFLPLLAECWRVPTVFGTVVHRGVVIAGGKICRWLGTQG